MRREDKESTPSLVMSQWHSCLMMFVTWSASDAIFSDALLFYYELGEGEASDTHAVYSRGAAMKHLAPL